MIYKRKWTDRTQYLADVAKNELEENTGVRILLLVQKRDEDPHWGGKREVGLNLKQACKQTEKVSKVSGSREGRNENYFKHG